MILKVKVNPKSYIENESVCNTANINGNAHHASQEEEEASHQIEVVDDDCLQRDRGQHCSCR